MESQLQHLPLALIVLDGWGLAPAWGGNATTLARTPVMEEFMRNMPHTQLKACGEAVGLPDGAMGGSEVGHLNIGAGKIVKQYLPLIDEQIANKKFFVNPILTDAVSGAVSRGNKIHIMGVFSDGGVHGHINHLFALLDLTRQYNASNVCLHLFTDGRDAEQTSALGYLDKLQKYIQASQNTARVATLCGRFYAMDRDNRWERTQLAYNTLFYGQGIVYADARSAISQSYAKGVYDEFIIPCVIGDANTSKVDNGDLIICLNFREDRMRQLVRAMCNKVDGLMDVGTNPPKAQLVTFVEYQAGLPAEVVFHKEEVEQTLASVFAENNMTQFHVAETEKYAHVTYFFNGGKEDPEPLESRLMIPSPKVTTYNLQPEMSAEGIKVAVIDKLKLNSTQFYVINFANADMVGHAGDLNATIVAVETVDRCLGEVWEAIKSVGGTLIVTADHGNAEQMINPADGTPYTEHTLNPVPFIIVSENPTLKSLRLKSGGFLGNIAPTILEIVGIQKPACMTLESLIEH